MKIKLLPPALLRGSRPASRRGVGPMGRRQAGREVVESSRLRSQSKFLLECAKKAVEIAIEQDENIAQQWLEEQTKSVEEHHAC